LRFTAGEREKENATFEISCCSPRKKFKPTTCELVKDQFASVSDASHVYQQIQLNLSLHIYRYICFSYIHTNINMISHGSSWKNYQRTINPCRASVEDSAMLSTYF